MSEKIPEISELGFLGGIGIADQSRSVYQKLHRSITLVNTWISMTVPPRVLEPGRIPSSEDLPSLSVVAALYKERNVVEQLYDALADLKYPKDKIEIIWVLEEQDKDTIQSILETFKNVRLDKMGLPVEIENRIKIIYNGERRMKANSLNTALKEVTGEYLVIYDADVIPEKDQALKAMAVFRDNPELKLVQAFTYSYNKDYNILTKLHDWEFSRDWDYSTRLVNFTDGYFNLKGHSFFVRTDVALSIGGWSSIVTEDLDFGIKMAINGHKMGIFNSTTYEEAPPTFRQVLRARTRWCKGHIISGISNLRKLHNSHAGLRTRFIISDTSLFRPLEKLLSPVLWLFLIYLLLQRNPIAVPLMAIYLVIMFPMPVLHSWRATKSIKSAIILKFWDILTCLFVYTGLLGAIFKPDEFSVTGHEGKKGANP